jgi:UDP-N-acetyl-2-amino-2-deoxyglucuronate dehydrogenase
VTVNVAIVGGGIIGRNHAAAIARCAGLAVTAVVDVDPSVKLDDGRFYASLAEALPSVDLVAVCTPSGLHADAVEQALAAGKHVVVEKPLEVSLPKARRLAALAAETGVVASVISQHRFDPASMAVAEALAAGDLGTPTSAVGSVAWWREQSYYDQAAWRGTWALDGGVVMNQAVHTVDLLIWLLGPVVEVFAQSATLAHERIEVEDVAVATLRFAAGTLAVLHATTAAYPGLTVRVEIYGSRGSAVIEDDELRYLSPGGRRPPVDKPDDAFVVGHLRQYEDVVSAISTGRPPAITFDDGVTALAVVTAIYASARTGRPVALKDVLS